LNYHREEHWPRVLENMALRQITTLKGVSKEQDREGAIMRSFTIGKGKVHPCTGTEALYRPYGPQGEYRYSCTLS